jgi:hypothetical protein
VTIRERLVAIVYAVADEAERNPRFAEKLRSLLVERPPPATKELLTNRPRSVGTPAARKGRRARAVLDPPGVYSEGEEVLRARLQELDLEQLRDIIAEYSMDPDRLAMKWKTPERLVQRILEVSRGRATKGDAFRS